jgi:hypothetical protein
VHFRLPAWSRARAYSISRTLRSKILPRSQQEGCGPMQILSIPRATSCLQGVLPTSVWRRKRTQTAPERLQLADVCKLGWDAVFEYEGETYVPVLSSRYLRLCQCSYRQGRQCADASPSYAEMEKPKKNKISHRGLALRKLQAWFDSASHANE